MQPTWKDTANQRSSHVKPYECQEWWIEISFGLKKQLNKILRFKDLYPVERKPKILWVVGKGKHNKSRSKSKQILEDWARILIEDRISNKLEHKTAQLYK